ncbi:protein MRVI1-like isoform X2 [Limulus polyphemus]|uniref:Protein MRVI1-like isoform X2 n=1 Tax=Limulus polyphemus TaxID=6850 RepID=A0ABM1BPD4_LIMPO|nr:protein MRVI1-like isoform X2 [Limulus polyphemus]
MNKPRKRELSLTSKRKSLMPDLMEASEPESIPGGSGESTENEDTHQLNKDGILTSINDPVFPSFPDKLLRKLGLQGNTPFSSGQLSEKEIENKFSKLSLGFRTDKLTLNQRIELQQRQRDTAEKSVENEAKTLKEYLNVLNQQSTTHQMRKLISKVQQQLEIVQQTCARVSSCAELYGAVQQEERMNRAFEVMVSYVENLKRIYEKDHQELEDTRRLLIENRMLPSNNETGGEEQGMPRLPRSMSISAIGKAEYRGRLFSTAGISTIGLGTTTTTNSNLSSKASSHLTLSSSATPSPKYLRSRRSSLPTSGLGLVVGRPSIVTSTLNNQGTYPENIAEQEPECVVQEEKEQGDKGSLKSDSSRKLQDSTEESNMDNHLTTTSYTESVGYDPEMRRHELRSLANCENREEVLLEQNYQGFAEDEDNTDQGSEMGENTENNLNIRENWTVRDSKL